MDREIAKVKTNIPPPLDEIGGEDKIEVPSYWFNMANVREKKPANSTINKLWADREKMRAERNWGGMAEQTCLLATSWKKAWDQLYEWELDRKKNITMLRHTANTKLIRLEARKRELEDVVAKEKDAKAKRQKVTNETYKKEQEEKSKKEQEEKNKKEQEEKNPWRAMLEKEDQEERNLVAELKRLLDEPEAEDEPDEDYRPPSSRSRSSTCIVLPDGPLL